MRIALIALTIAMPLSTAAMAADPAPAAPAAAAPAATANPDDLKMICRRDKETGSLVKSKKTCHTKAQWAYIDDTNQAFSRDLVDTTRTRQGGN
jgi:predicted transglutaminase-like cysteine proteinase